MMTYGKSGSTECVAIRADSIGDAKEKARLWINHRRFQLEKGKQAEYVIQGEADLFYEQWYKAIIIYPDSSEHIGIIGDPIYTTPDEIRAAWMHCKSPLEYVYKKDIHEPEFDKGYTVMTYAKNNLYECIAIRADSIDDAREKAELWIDDRIDELKNTSKN